MSASRLRSETEPGHGRAAGAARRSDISTAEREPDSPRRSSAPAADPEYGVSALDVFLERLAAGGWLLRYPELPTPPTAPRSVVVVAPDGGAYLVRAFEDARDVGVDALWRLASDAVVCGAARALVCLGPGTYLTAPARRAAAYARMRVLRLVT